MRVKEALNLIKSLDESLKNEALFILAECLQKDKAWLFLNLDFAFNERRFLSALSRFLKGFAFEYIFKKASFYGLDFYIEKGVLIPRFDSEVLLELCLKELRENSYQNILEIGFGSGILSIVIALKTGLKITALDVSKKALKIAQINAKRHGVSHLINFQLMDFKKLENKFDFIFSNPPYIKKDYALDIFVSKEPKKALFGGTLGHEILEQIIIFASSKGTKTLACEFGYDQREILEKILKQQGFKPKFYKDLQGFDRAFIAKKENC